MQLARRQMPILFTDLLKDPAFEIKNRKDIKELYETIKENVKNKKLNLEGHTLPDSFITWIKSVEGDKKLPKTDTDVVDFSLAQDAKYDSWRKSYLIAKNPIFMTQSEKELITHLQTLDKSAQESLAAINASKDDIVATLSDLQANIALFLTYYDKNKTKLKLPDRHTALERVKTKKARTVKAATS